MKRQRDAAESGGCVAPTTGVDVDGSQPLGFAGATGLSRAGYFVLPSLLYFVYHIGGTMHYLASE